MKISKLKLKNFRCFGEQEATINLTEDLTAFVGANSSGKSTVFLALLKLFSPDAKDRLISKSDFHVPPDNISSDLIENSFYIEVIFDFETDGNEKTVPHFWERMVIEEEGASPYLRMRLEATWKNSNISPEGEINYSLFYLTSSDDTIEIEDDDNKSPVPSHHRQLIQAIYIPAIRRPSGQLKYTTGTILWRLMKSVKWDDDFKTVLSSKLGEVNAHMSTHSDFNNVKNTIGDFWKKFHSDKRYSTSSLVVGNSDFSELLKKIDVEFQPTETGRPYQIVELGEGLRSLFYISLVCSLLKIENEIENVDEFNKPILTLLMVEEPENHISPHLLGKVVGNISTIAKQPNAQVLLSSHTPAIIKRIEPESIRHLRIDKLLYYTVVSEVTLPEKSDEAYKYIKEAVRNYPEIYFSNIVLIGEGETEEIIFNRFLRVTKVGIDESGISIVPLGHRFVNHVWKLLDDLSIPHITLLDLDFERNGGSWGRIKYAIKQLRKIGKAGEIKFKSGKTLSDKTLEEFHTKESTNTKKIKPWVKYLEQFDLFYSFPLDLDFLLLSIFSDEYNSTIPKNGGPQIPDKTKNLAKFNEKLETGIRATLKPKGGNGESYSEDEKELMIWYNYHFLGRGKPSTHIAALSEIDDKDLEDKMPEVFTKIFNRMNEILNPIEEPTQENDED